MSKSLKLYEYADALSHTVFINSDELQSYIYVEIPIGIAKFLSLYQINELVQDKKPIDTDYIGHIIRDGKHPWLKVDTSILNMSAGYHLYQMLFYNCQINDTISYYLSYQIQTSSPNKTSYIYMMRDGEIND